MKILDEKQALARLEALCAKSEHCSGDVYSKALRYLGGDAQAARRVTDSLLAQAYVDDVRYCRAFASDKAQFSGWGPYKITAALMSKGIDRALIDRALNEITTDAPLRKLYAELSRKYSSAGDDSPQTRAKLIRFALSRGFSYDTVTKVVDKVMKSEDR